MNNNERHIEEFVKDIPFDAPDGRHRDVLKKQLLDAFPGHRLQQTDHTVKIWRTIMKSRKIQLATAATVILIVSLICYWSDTSIVTQAYAISDMPALLYSADNVYMKGTMYLAPQRNTGAKPVAIATEYWLDLANGRWRMTWPGFGGGPGFSEVSVEEKICDGGKLEIVVNPDKKTFYHNSVSEFQRHLFCLRHTKQLVNKAIGSPNSYDSYRAIGHEEIGRKRYDIWEVVQEKQEYIPAFKMRSWLSPETGEFAKVITWTQQPGGSWQKSGEIDSVRRNIEMPDEIFSVTPPKGYRPERPRYTPPNGLTTGRGSVLSISLSTHIIFAMSDGSIIACWSCEDGESRVSQAGLFKDMEMGGPLPKLPFEVSALKAIHKGKTIKYDGYHLAHTVMKGKFHEWGIYVPVGDVRPEYPERVSYFFIYEDNAGKTNGNVPSSYGGWAELTIKNKEDFDTWIRGAMAELSDNGIAPENVTYENITKVISDLRTSPQD